MGLWYLNDHYPQPVRVSYLHLAQPPRLVCRHLDNIHSGLFQLTSYAVEVSHLQPQSYTLAGSSARGARELKEASSEKENHAPGGSAAPLAVDVQTEEIFDGRYAVDVYKLRSINSFARAIAECSIDRRKYLQIDVSMGMRSMRAILCGVLRQGSSSNPLARSSPDHRGAFQAALNALVAEERALEDLGA